MASRQAAVRRCTEPIAFLPAASNAVACQASTSCSHVFWTPAACRKIAAPATCLFSLLARPLPDGSHPRLQALYRHPERLVKFAAAGLSSARALSPPQRVCVPCCALSSGRDCTANISLRCLEARVLYRASTAAATCLVSPAVTVLACAAETVYGLGCITRPGTFCSEARHSREAPRRCSSSLLPPSPSKSAPISARSRILYRIFSGTMPRSPDAHRAILPVAPSKSDTARRAGRSINRGAGAAAVRNLSRIRLRMARPRVCVLHSGRFNYAANVWSLYYAQGVQEHAHPTACHRVLTC